jgi:hypothetical protein
VGFASQAIDRQKASVAADLDLMANLFRRVNCPSSFSFRQWCHFSALILEFRPDVVLEIGRSLGGSTTAMTQAVQHLEHTKVKSWCITDDWTKETVPKLRDLVPPGWFDRLEAYRADVHDVDFTDHVRDASRVFFFWDSFHHRVNERVFTHLLPLLAEKAHIVAVHDVSDNRYASGGLKSYEGKGYYRNEDEFYAFPNQTARLNIGWVNTVTNGALPILDFCYRNNIELHSVDHELFEDIVRDETKLNQIRACLNERVGLPEAAFHPPHDFAYFSLNEARGPYQFPARVAERDELEKMRIALYELFYAGKRTSVKAILLHRLLRVLANPRRHLTAVADLLGKALRKER